LYDGKIVNHAHNDYLEAAETGTLGGAVRGFSGLSVYQGTVFCNPETIHLQTHSVFCG
jgi:hypothetical protein